MSEAKAGGAVSTYTVIGNVDANGKAQSLATTPLSVDSTAADGFLSGDGTKNVTTAGTRVALAASTAVKWVVVTARPANTGKIAVGTSTVVAAAGSERGIVLAAGQSTGFAVSNLSTINIDATVSGEGVAFAYGS